VKQILIVLAVDGKSLQKSCAVH